MVARYRASTEKPRFPARRVAAPHRLPFVFAVLVVGFTTTAACADNPDDQRRQQTVGVQRASQLTPPARVVLPAPWEPATPAQPATASTEPSGRK